jgi:hypothetical protein
MARPTEESVVANGKKTMHDSEEPAGRWRLAKHIVLPLISLIVDWYVDFFSS